MDRMVCSFAGIYSMYHRRPLLEKRYERRSHRGHGRWIWYYLLQETTNIHTFFAALVLATAAYIIVSKLTKKPPQEVLDLFYYAKSFDPADAVSEAADPAKAVAESSSTAKPSPIAAGVQMSKEQFQAILEMA